MQAQAGSDSSSSDSSRAVIRSSDSRNSSSDISIGDMHVCTSSNISDGSSEHQPPLRGVAWLQADAHIVLACVLELMS